ncbi:hypothetical protein V7201_14190 [Bacillus sp. JJ1122]
MSYQQPLWGYFIDRPNDYLGMNIIISFKADMVLRDFDKSQR